MANTYLLSVFSVTFYFLSVASIVHAKKICLCSYEKFYAIRQVVVAKFIPPLTDCRELFDVPIYSYTEI